jgi:hypothetical protein
MAATCPICGPCDVNCRCTSREQDQYEEIQRLRLTDEERKALEIAVEYVGSAYAVEHHAKTIERLLERTAR